MTTDADEDEFAISLNDLRQAIHAVRAKPYLSLEMRQLLLVLRGAEHSWSHDQQRVGELIFELQALRHRWHDVTHMLTAEYENANERVAALERYAAADVVEHHRGQLAGFARALDILTGRPDEEPR